MSQTIDAAMLPLGFEASGVSAKIKKSGMPDLALFYSKASCAAAGMFTVNRVKAAPVAVSLKHIASKAHRAIVVNSGNANCMTGPQGMRDALCMTEDVARALSLGKEEVLVCSTGIIGRPLEIEKITASIPKLVKNLSTSGLFSAAQAILTTDTCIKEVSAKVEMDGKVVTISGVAKGAGMIAPQMKTATMLAFLLTDANIAKPALKKILKDAVDESFNAITIDGCMSTNDTVLAMANGLADNKSIKLGTKQARDFAQVLKEVCLKLARMIVSDAEGATKFITVHVKGAMNALSAKRLAFSISNSLLFKCAIFGQLANWGRIAAAMGSVIPKESLEKMDIALNKTFLLKSGVPCVLKKRLNLSAGAVDVDVDCKSGKGQARVFTSDLSCDYVKINAAN